MATGYTRNDTSNDIANGNVVNADDLDGEFDAIQSAFDATTGHTHDGTVGGGAPIESIGPAKDVVATTSVLRPKTDNTVDLGTPTLEFKDLYLDGTANIDSLVADTADINGGTIDGAVIGGTTPAAISGTTGTFSGDFAVGTNSLFVDSSTDYVGIGTASPAVPLEVKTSGYVKFRVTDGTTTPFSIATGLNQVTIENNSVADTSDEYIALSAVDNTIRIGTNGSEAVRINSAQNVGLGTTAPTERLSVTGNVTISGSLSKGSGSFRIPHPIREGYDLVHSFVEGPQADNIYRGRVNLVDGMATVNLDEAGRMTEGTFVALNGNIQCFTSNETDWCPVRGSVVGNILTIEAQDNTCTDTISWMVIGERIDQHMIDTEWTDENGRVITEPLTPVVDDEDLETNL